VSSVIIQVSSVNAFIRKAEKITLLKTRKRQRDVIVPPSNADEDRARRVKAGKATLTTPGKQRGAFVVFHSSGLCMG
jgi:hypothetical protein